MNIKKWEVSALDKDRAAQMAEDYNIPFFLAMMLDIRGITEEGKIREFLGDDAPFSDPFLMKDMDKAVERIRQAVDSFERIAVYGDYDADGVTATAILFTYLEALGADVIYYIPQREGEGYGMNRNAVETLRGKDVNLIITVDNGISSVEEVAFARELGMDVVVTDHHRPQKELPQAAAVVDAYREDDESPFQDFSGAGVVLKLLVAMEDGEAEGILEEYADLAALGTIGDVVPMTGENRTLVRAGLQAISRGGRPGLDALLRQCCSGREITSVNLSYTAIPRINATGRMGSPDRAVQLLICEDEEEAEGLAQEICGENEERRRVESEIVAEAMASIESNPDLLHARVIVVSGKNWHHGVIGIVASRIVDRFGKPCYVISEDGETAKGSGRSVDGFSLFQATSCCADLLERFGGHPMAAGITLRAENIDPFRQEINRYAGELYPELPTPVLRLDCRLNPASLSVDMPQTLALLEPFGNGNPQPVFGLFGMRLLEVRPVGNGNHLRLTCQKADCKVTCMMFRTKLEEFLFPVNAVIDLAVSLYLQEYKGEAQLTVNVRDVRLSGMDGEEHLKSWGNYESFLRGESLSKEKSAALTPDRNDMAALYRKLVALGGRPFSPQVLLSELPGFQLGKLMICLDALKERGLIQWEGQTELMRVTVLQAKEKVDLFGSPVLQRLKIAGEAGSI